MTERYQWSTDEFDYELEFYDPNPEEDDDGKGDDTGDDNNSEGSDNNEGGDEEDEDDDEEDDDYEDDEDEDEDENGDGDDDEDDDDDDDDGEASGDTLLHLFTSFLRRSMAREAPARPPSPTPMPDFKTGHSLIHSGEFGPTLSPFDDSRYWNHSRSKNVTEKLWKRQLRNRPVHPLHMGETYLPSNPGKVVDVYDCAAYSAQFSNDGSLLASCDQDFNLHIYRTHGDELVKQKTIQGAEGNWTITDLAISPDNGWLVYSSLNPYVHLTRIGLDDSTEQYPLDFSVDGDTVRIWSVRFSGNGREIVAGGTTQLLVYDIESRTVLTSVYGHAADVNAVCFAEPQSSHVIFSGSDDNLVKVWDRRSMRSSGRSPPSGVLVGHAAGVTYVTSKGDNRYLASNGKDQKMLLWDLRKMYSSSEYQQLPRETYRADVAHFDYRRGRFPGSKSIKLRNDCSVMTFQGHSVLRTLIRCHFSPAHTTGGRYLYTGSADGVVKIYRMDGTVVRELDTGKVLHRQRRRSSLSPAWPSSSPSTIARDVSWHPYSSTIVSTCWASSGMYGYDSTGVLVKHSFRHASDIEPPSARETESEASDSEHPPTRRRRLI
ncbi:hypothetical protein BGZ73_005100 [Actinomortierella ambigua]|nr:hypothetical protein BGZ73_005100 [Actinomortierella ambigua]